MSFGTVASVSVGAAVAIAFGMFFFGIGATVGAQRFAARYRAAHGLTEKDALPFMPMELLKWAQRRMGGPSAKLAGTPAPVAAGVKAPAVPPRPATGARAAPARCGRCAVGCKWARARFPRSRLCSRRLDGAPRAGLMVSALRCKSGVNQV